MQKTVKLLATIILTAMTAIGFTACGKEGASEAGTNNVVAATVDGKPIMSAEVERQISLQAGGKQAQLSQLQMAQARLQVLDNLIQREVLFQRAEKEKLLPTEDQINGAINAQKTQSGMTDEDFAKSLKEQNVTMDVLKEEAKKDLAIKALQDKYAGKISISDREVEDFYNNNRQQFVNSRGVALAMIVVDPADNGADGIQNDAKNDTDAKLKIDGIYQQLQGKADFATVARAKSEDVNTLRSGGDLGRFLGEDDLKSGGFPEDLITRLFGPMQVGDYTQPVRFNSGKWYVFKLEERRLQSENLTLESPGVRPQITQGLIKQRNDILTEALVKVAVAEAKIVNNLATNMLANPGNLGLRPASSPGTESSPASPTATEKPAASPAAATSPKGAATGPAASPTKK